MTVLIAQICANDPPTDEGLEQAFAMLEQSLGAEPGSMERFVEYVIPDPEVEAAVLAQVHGGVRRWRPTTTPPDISPWVDISPHDRPYADPDVEGLVWECLSAITTTLQPLKPMRATTVMEGLSEALPWPHMPDPVSAVDRPGHTMAFEGIFDVREG